MKEYDYEKIKKQAESSYRNSCISLIDIIICLILAVIMFWGCSPEVIEKIEKQTDTCHIEKIRRDSIYQHDSIYIHEWQKGDTVYLERDRWHTEWREKVIRDTVYISRRDTLTTIQYVDKPADISGWQWAQIWAGRIAMITIALLAGGWLLYLVIRKHI